MKNKPIIILLVVLLLLSTSATVYGYMNSKEPKTTPAPTPVAPTITYEYYLEEQLVNEMPNNTNEDGTKVDFSRYICDNGMEIEFNEETWTYNTLNETNGICRLYFVKGEYTVTITATNGLINGEEASYSFNVPRATDGQFNIIPNEGYEYGTVTCANEKEATFDISTNMLNITSISEDTACKIDFEKRNLKVEVVVKNGTGTTTEYKEYGESISLVVEPNEGYEKPKYECTNKQVATYTENKLTIDKLTDETKCTVIFSKTPAVTFNLTIDNIPQEVTITAGNKDQKIESGKDGKFSLRAENGYHIVLDCNGIKPSTEQEDPDGTVTYTFLGVSRNITCSISTELAETPPTDDELGD